MITHRKSLLAMLLLGGLAGCSPDYTGIREWAFSATGVIDDRSTAQFAPVTPAPEADKRRLDGMLAVQDAAIIYLRAIAALAMDGLLTHETDPLTDKVAAAAAVDAAAGQHVAALGKLMVTATDEMRRAPQLRQTIAEGEPHIQPLLATLRGLLEAANRDDTQALAALRAEYQQLQDQVRDAGAKDLATRLQPAREAALINRIERRRAYMDALTRISEIHHFMAEHRSGLAKSDSVRRLHFAAAELRRFASTPEAARR